MIDMISLANYALNGLVEGLLIALPALALTLVMGISRFANAATGDFLTVSAYAAVGMQKVFAGSLWMAAGGAVAGGMLVAVLGGWLVYRPLRGRPLVTSLIASIGVALFVRSVLTFFVGHDQQTITVPLARAWNFGGVRVLPTDLVVAGAALAAMALLFAILFTTTIGRQMRAVSDNPDLARSSGIQAQRVLQVQWLMVGALCGVGGILYGVKALVVPDLGWDLLVPAFAAMVAGGMGNPVGAVLAGLLLGVVQELAVPIVGPSYKVIVSFALLLVVLLFRPQGLLGTATTVR